MSTLFKMLANMKTFREMQDESIRQWSLQYAREKKERLERERIERFNALEERVAELERRLDMVTRGIIDDADENDDDENYVPDDDVSEDDDDATEDEDEDAEETAKRVGDSKGLKGLKGPKGPEGPKKKRRLE